MKKDKIYMFKVVSGNPGNYQSARVTSKFTITYPFNTWVYPRLIGSKIMVYETYQDALKFSSYYEHIFLCEVRDIQKMEYSATYHDTIEYFWSMYNIRVPNVPLTHFDNESVYGCGSIKLVRKLR